MVLKRALGFGIILLTACLAAAQEPASVVDTPPTELNSTAVAAPAEPWSLDGLLFFCDRRLRIETPDKNFTLAFGGRLNFDVGSVFQSDDNKKAFGHMKDGTEFRRVRFELDGTLFHDIFFRGQYEFSGDSFAFKDVFVGVQNVPLLGNLHAGNYKEPFSLEGATSSKHITFMERALPVAAFSPARNAGIGFQNHWNERVTYALGFFDETPDTAIFDLSDGYALTGRLTASPIYANEGRSLLHLGAAYSLRWPADDKVRYRTRPEWNMTDARFVDTGVVANVEGVDLLGLESALVMGPFSVQGEYTRSFVNRGSGYSDASFDGWYVQGSYFLTGEHLAYDPKTAVFTKTAPNRNLSLGGKEKGWGAWEAVARYSSIDLNDAGAGVSGGKENNITLGLNWYMDPNTKIMLNWTHATTDDPDNGHADILGMRLAVEF